MIRSDDSESFTDEITKVGVCLFALPEYGNGLLAQHDVEECFADVSESDQMAQAKEAILAAFVVPQLGVTLDDQTQKIVISLLCLQKSYQNLSGDSVSLEDLQPAANLCFGHLDNSVFGEINDAVQSTIEFLASSAE